MIYLDTAATTPVRPEVLEAMWPILTSEFGNPSSRHEVGEVAARALAEARASIALDLGCRASEIIFTSGGSEADNLAVKGITLANPRGRHIVTSRIEHEAVLESCDYLRRFHGCEITFVDVGPDGLIDPHAVLSVVRPDTTLVSLQHANNEVGTVQPIAAIAQLLQNSGVIFHTDAVQSAGWLDVGLATLGVDALSLSGHKLGAPKGVGVLAVRGAVFVEPTVHGGGQERGRRSGTENVAAAVGLAVALRLASNSRVTAALSTTRVRDVLISGVLSAVPNARLTGHNSERLPNHASFCFAGVPGLPALHGEALLIELQRRGVIASSGSACAAGSDEPSHVLTALGYDADLATTAVRFTLGAETTEQNARDAVDRLVAAVS